MSEAAEQRNRPLDEPPDGAPSTGPLAGFSVVLTASRRIPEWTASLGRQGATVVEAPALKFVPLPAAGELLAATRELIADPGDDVLITTAIGLRGWIEAADAHGLETDLLAALGTTRLWARGAKALGALHQVGLTRGRDLATGETTRELVDRLIAEGVRGRRITVQLHGVADEEAVERLTAAGARVHTVPVYGWGPPTDPVALHRAITTVCGRTTDAVIFVSAPGSAAFLDAARELGRLDELLAAFDDAVLAAAIGPVTAGPLVEAGIAPLVPDRYRLGAMVRALSAHLPTTRVLCRRLPGGELLELRGRVALLDGEQLALPPGPFAVLRMLAAQPGEVISRDRLLAALPGGGTDGHAVDVAVGRVRAALGTAAAVETVVKRGYRLAGPP